MGLDEVRRSWYGWKSKEKAKASKMAEKHTVLRLT